MKIDDIMVAILHPQKRHIVDPVFGPGVEELPPEVSVLNWPANQPASHNPTRLDSLNFTALIFGTVLALIGGVMYWLTPAGSQDWLIGLGMAIGGIVAWPVTSHDIDRRSRESDLR